MGIGSSTLRHSAIYSVATVLGRLAGFIMLPFYAHIFQAEGYGVIGMIDTSLGLLTVLLAGGLQTAILRVYHEHSDQATKNVVLGTGILLVWGIGAALVALPILFSASISKVVLGSANYYLEFCLALVIFVVEVAGQSASTIQIVRQQSVLFSVIGLVRLVLGLGLNIWLVVVLQVGLIGVFISSFVSAVVAALAFHIVAAREHGFGFDRKIAIALMGFQLPLLPGEIVAFVGRQAERVVVRMQIGIEAMGVLEMAYKFAPLLNQLIAIPFRRAWTTKSIEIAANNGAPAVIGEMFTHLMFVMIFAGLVMAVSIPGLLELMTPPEFWQAARVAQVEIVTTIVGVAGTYLTFGLIYRKKTITLSVVKLVLTPLKIVMAIAFVAKWGLAGAAYSALVIELVSIVWISSRSQACYRIPIEYGKLFLMVVVAAALFTALDGNAYAQFAPADFVREHVFASSLSVLQDLTPAGGKLARMIQYLGERQEPALRALLNAVSCLAFLGLFPVILKRSARDRLRDSGKGEP